MPATYTDSIDGLATSLAEKAPVRVATTTNITLSGEQTIDSVAVVSGDRVLVKDQTDTTENGIYVVSASAWIRALDFNGNRDVIKGTSVRVANDSLSDGSLYVVTSDNPITIGATALTFASIGALAGSDIDGTLVTDNGVQREIQAALSDRPVQFESFESIKNEDLSGYDSVETVGFYTGWEATTAGPKGGATYHRDGTTANGTTTFASTAYADNSGFYDVNGDGFKILINPCNGVYISTLGGVSDAGTTDNATAVANAYALAVSSNCRVVKWDGQYGFGTKITLPANVATIGNEGWFASASSMPECSIIWTGGATPMFDMSVSLVTFRGVTIANDGTATDFIEMNSGAQRLFLDWIFVASAPTYTRFSRSFVRSNGNRLGYSEITHIYASGSPAPALFDVDGQGTANGITTFTIRGGIIGASGADMTVLQVDDESFEVVTMEHLTFIDDGAGSILKAIDTTISPVSNAIQTLNFLHNEVEVKYGAGTEAFMELENVVTCNFKHNQVDGTGTEQQIINATNSCVEVDGNTFIQVPGTEIVDADDDSWVISGKNTWAGTTPVPICTNLAATTGRVVQADASSLILDLTCAKSDGTNVIREINVNTASSFSIRSTLAQATAGMVLTVVIRNISGGVAAAPSFFSTHFNLETTSPTAPADGYMHSYTFYYDGSRFTELRRNEGTIANT